LLHNNKIIWSILTKKDLSRLKGREEDVDAVAGEMLTVKGVEAAVFFREQNKKLLRVSLRSKGKVNVAMVAERHNGGGHFDSAGCRITDTKNAKQELLDQVINLLS
jgi:phosphoesterase RecJ-like protein